MKNIKFTIEYEGTNYCGWQRQDNVDTIQERIETVLEKLTGEEIKLIGSGRTDKGVHALGQVANFRTKSNIPALNYRLAMQEFLPPDITIVDSREVNYKFHSRFDARSKIYKYRVYNGKYPRALLRNFYYHYYHDLDFYKIVEASKAFIGTHDFRSFMGRKSSAYSTIRTVKDIKIERDGDFIVFEIHGISFLKHMIRIMIGTLLQIGSGKIEKKDIISIMEGRGRSLAGITAPAHGLYLEKVFYDQKHLDFDS